MRSLVFVQMFDVFEHLTLRSGTRSFSTVNSNIFTYCTAIVEI